MAFLLAGCATAATTRPPVAPTPVEQLHPAAPADIVRLVGWGDARVLVLARMRWTPTAGAGLDALVLERRAGDAKEIALALVRDGGLAGLIPLGRVVSAPGRSRSVSASLGELPLGPERALRVDTRTFDGGEAQLFAVKTSLVALDGDGPKTVLDRLVESGDRVRDRRAELSVEDVDGDGTPEVVALERESGKPGGAPRRVVYRRGKGGRFVTKDRSMFDPDM